MNKMESTETWADNELRLACEASKHDNYGIMCYESAKKAFYILMSDHHSGCSIGITKHILNRLIDGKPLTPIHDDPNIWIKIDFGVHEQDDDIYVCSRMTSLTKHIHSDGTITYSDSNRVECYNANDPGCVYGFGIVTDVIDNLYPITLPYFPPTNNFKVKCIEGSYKKNLYNPSAFDTFAIISVTRPNGEIDNINRYFKETDNNGWVEIDKEEFTTRIASRDDDTI